MRKFFSKSLALVMLVSFCTMLYWGPSLSAAAETLYSVNYHLKIKLAEPIDNPGNTEHLPMELYFAPDDETKYSDSQMDRATFNLKIPPITTKTNVLEQYVILTFDATKFPKDKTVPQQLKIKPTTIYTSSLKIDYVLVTPIFYTDPNFINSPYMFEFYNSVGAGMEASSRDEPSAYYQITAYTADEKNANTSDPIEYGLLFGNGASYGENSTGILSGGHTKGGSTITTQPASRLLLDFKNFNGIRIINKGSNMWKCSRIVIEFKNKRGETEASWTIFPDQWIGGKQRNGESFYNIYITQTSENSRQYRVTAKVADKSNAKTADTVFMGFSSATLVEFSNNAPDDGNLNERGTTFTCNVAFPNGHELSKDTRLYLYKNGKDGIYLEYLEATNIYNGSATSNTYHFGIDEWIDDNGLHGYTCTEVFQNPIVSQTLQAGNTGTRQLRSTLPPVLEVGQLSAVLEAALAEGHATFPIEITNGQDEIMYKINIDINRFLSALKSGSFKGNFIQSGLSVENLKEYLEQKGLSVINLSDGIVLKPMADELPDKIELQVNAAKLCGFAPGDNVNLYALRESLPTAAIGGEDDGTGRSLAKLDSELLDTMTVDENGFVTITLSDTDALVLQKVAAAGTSNAEITLPKTSDETGTYVFYQTFFCAAGLMLLLVLERTKKKV